MPRVIAIMYLLCAYFCFIQDEHWLELSKELKIENFKYSAVWTLK